MAYKEKGIEKSIRQLQKSREKLIKAKALRIWIERNPNINIANYPFMRVAKRKEIEEIKKELENKI